MILYFVHFLIPAPIFNGGCFNVLLVRIHDIILVLYENL